MAYRRKQGIQRSATFVEDHRQTSSGGSASPAIASPRATRFADDNRRPDRSSRLAAQAFVSSSAAREDLTLPSFGDRFPAAAAAASQCDAEPSSPVQDPVTHLYTSTTSLNDEGPKYDIELSKKDHKHGFWALVAQKAKVMLDENGTPRAAQTQTSESRWSYDRVRSSESQSPMSRRGSLDGRLDIGGKIKDVLEEGLAVADGATSGTHGGVVAARKLQIRRKACSMDFRAANLTPASPDTSPMLADTESPQIKASRDVANAMAAKVKLLQRELKTVKADLAFSKERCAQLEEENRLLRDGNHDADADEDLIRQQLETLVAEKARLAHENTVYARENRFLREIVEYHQLNMQDVVNLDDDDIEEEDDYDVEDEDAELEAEHHQDRCKSPPSQLELEEEEHRAADPATEPQSPSRHRESPRMLSTNSGGSGGGGGTPDHESPRMMNTNSGGGGGTPDHESPRILNTNSGGGGTPEHESPRMLNTNSGGTPDHESPRMLNTNSGGTPGHESPRMLNTNSGVGIAASESPRMLSTNSGGNTNESPRSFKADDGSSPETTRDG
ncbi:hypothetical protein BDA96_09G185700 [Sorghum bicolor]|uniref:Uncharacterized protein n=2 Tax=Sorghum bicolor TaxID=4558 RepID=A0A921QB55_SORBI|nr:uncharacterized protein LOC8077013 isoform X2 [Sorghum bicolor]KAG0518553.1 hypothetical protein BDA96_09G185700 [Sorghum bicolor]OQU78197.1 hypothetical protein SORBI_3009G176200 [Sorghum bicolor]|eukprot:XP_021304116.1 uncharacterized protein LOC8077013 isoform X2 [Sorghum bicolor]